MPDILRFTKTFSEVQSNSFVDGSWKVARLSEVGIDEQVNEWVAETKNVIIDVFTSVHHSSVQEDTHLTKVDRVVTYMSQGDYQRSVNPSGSVETAEVSPGVQRVTRRAGGPPTAEEISEAVRQLSNNRSARGDRRSLPDNLLQTLPRRDTLTAESDLSEKVTQEPAELDNPEEAEKWQEEEGASPETARREAELVARELQTAITAGKLPPDLKKRDKRGQRVVKNPTPPIKVENPNEGLSPQEIEEKRTQEQSALKGIPSRRKRSR